MKIFIKFVSRTEYFVSTLTIRHGPINFFFMKLFDTFPVLKISHTFFRLITIRPRLLAKILLSLEQSGFAESKSSVLLKLVQESALFVTVYVHTFHIFLHMSTGYVCIYFWAWSSLFRPWVQPAAVLCQNVFKSFLQECLLCFLSVDRAELGWHFTGVKMDY